MMFLAVYLVMDLSFNPMRDAMVSNSGFLCAFPFFIPLGVVAHLITCPQICSPPTSRRKLCMYVLVQVSIFVIFRWFLVDHVPIFFISGDDAMVARVCRWRIILVVSASTGDVITDDIGIIKAEGEGSVKVMNGRDGSR